MESVMFVFLVGTDDEGVAIILIEDLTTLTCFFLWK